MTLNDLTPQCAARGHCEQCLTYITSVTCCECGDALVPWHPEIQWLVMDGRVSITR